ncbi:MAG TPA: SRPBCC family protein [Candidatus Thermoplasmatota archaeon]|nr:SRPBCC family protein [Candidatus Thermoplasmatota archaeon]
MTSTTQDTDLTIALTRVFRASPERVFAAWTDPAKLARWFGPDGFSTTTHRFELRPGGEWHHTMRGPDGREYPNRIRFVEVDPPRKLVYDHLSEPHFRTTVTFHPEGEGTRMLFEMRFQDPGAHRSAVETYGAVQGLEQTTARLAAFVDGFTLEREFRAAPERVWRMWTTEEGLMKWWALSAKEMGYDFRVEALDVRVGGRYAFRMTGNGHDLVNGGTYRRVEPFTTLAWTWHFDIFLAPGQKPYDVPMLLTLEALPNGGTRMAFTQGPLATPEHTEGSRQGVEANFAKLAKALAE